MEDGIGLAVDESREPPEIKDLRHLTEIGIDSDVANEGDRFFEFWSITRSDSHDKVELLPFQEIQLDNVHSPEHMKEILANGEQYLIAHKTWEIPDSILYREPVETQCDIDSTCADVTADDMVPAAEENSVQARVRTKRGGRKHKGHFMKRPMATSEVIEELLDENLRENALRCLSGHLIERREQDPEFYQQAGFFLFHSCGTLAILLQEVLVVYNRLHAGDLNVRGSKRLANVLCLLQSIAANDETRIPFVTACIPNYLIPFIRSEYTEEVYENLRAISLSVIGILCQAREKEIIKWALQNDIIDMCFYALDIGSELSKVISMSILDSILRVEEGLSAICEARPSCDLLLQYIKLCADLVSVLAVIQGFSPRLLFLVVRSYILLCQNDRALELLRDQLPSQLQDTTFLDVKIEYPLFSYLRHQLLLNTGKAKGCLPSVPGSLETSLEPSPASSENSNDDKENRPRRDSKPSIKLMPDSVDVYVTPMRPIDLNKQEWSSSARNCLCT